MGEWDMKYEIDEGKAHTIQVVSFSPYGLQERRCCHRTGFTKSQILPRRGGVRNPRATPAGCQDQNGEAIRRV
jgi:hypothetical protein